MFSLKNKYLNSLIFLHNFLFYIFLMIFPVSFGFAQWFLSNFLWERWSHWWEIFLIFYYRHLASLVLFSCSVVSSSLQRHGLQYARPRCSMPTPGVYSKSCPLSQWCHQTILYWLLLLPPSIIPSIRVFSNKSVICIRWPKYWSVRFSISPSSEYSRLISFRVFRMVTLETPCKADMTWGLWSVGTILYSYRRAWRECLTKHCLGASLQPPEQKGHGRALRSASSRDFLHQWRCLPPNAMFKSNQRPKLNIWFCS